MSIYWAKISNKNKNTETVFMTSMISDY